MRALLTQLAARYRTLVRRGRIDDETEAELQTHLAQLTERFMRDGMSAGAAAAAARRQMGNLTLLREDIHRSNGLPWLDDIAQDARYAIRGFGRDRRFAAVVILTLALGIGITTAVFSIYNAVLLRPLPYPDPERLYYLTLDGGMPSGAVPSTDFAIWRERATSFSQMAAYDNSLDQTLVTAGEAVRAQTAWASSDFWPLVGVRPLIGSLPEPDAQNEILLSYQFYQRQFGGDPDVIGQTVELNGTPSRVVGILPDGFHLRLPRDSYAPGGGALPQRDPEVYRPYAFAIQPRNRGFAGVRLVARLAPGVSIDEARAELESIRTGLAQSDPLPFEDRATLRVEPLANRLTGGVRTALALLLAAVVLVLLIVCANVASLLLARSSARQHELSVRASLGAQPSRLARQLLTESAVLSTLGGGAGVGVAYALVGALVRWNPYAVPRLTEASVDGRVLVFALGTAVLTTLAFGTGPALALRKARANDALRSGAAHLSALPGGLRARRLLVIFELALALLLTAGAALMLRSAAELYAYPPGFEPERILTLGVQLTGPRYAGRDAAIPQREYADDALARLRAIPGVEAVAVSTYGGTIFDVVPEGSEPNTEAGAFASPAILDASSEEFPRTLGVRVLRGRWFTDAEPSPVLVVNDALVRQKLAGKDPLGLRLRLPGPRNAPPVFATIVGVVDEPKYPKLDAEPQPHAYMSYHQSRALFGFGIFIRTAGSPSSIMPAVRATLRAVDPTQAPSDVQTLEQLLSESVAPRRFNFVLLGAFALCALLVALVGVYGVVAYSVAQRTREFGIRISLGATPQAVVRLLMRNTVPVLLAGTVLGLAAALGLTRLMTALLYQVSPTDPLTFGCVTCLFVVAALAATWLPARRASSVDPVGALRVE